MKTVKKSDFAGLVDYITDEQDKLQRVGKVTVTNCHQELARDAALEVQATQALNKRSAADKTYHLLLSFRPGEEVPDDVLAAIESRICAGLGFGEHQRISAVHHDTDNLHIHIAINKIHPRRHTVFDPYCDHKTLGQLCAALEAEYGLERDNHAPMKQGAENRAADMEHAAGVESLLGWIQRGCMTDLKKAASWEQLHQVLRENGLALQQQGNGLVISDQAGVAVKASSVARDLSMPKLEARFGAFEATERGRAGRLANPQQIADRAGRARVARPGTTPPPERQNRLRSLGQLGTMAIAQPRRYAQQPMPSGARTVELYARYRDAQKSAGEQQAAELLRAQEAKQRLIAAAKRTANLKRTTIKMMGGTSLTKKALYALTTKTLRAEIEQAKRLHQKARSDIQGANKRLAWADWLKVAAQQGDAQALSALRARGARRPLQGNTVTGPRAAAAPIPGASLDGITKKGTVIYRVGVSAVRDDGDSLKVSKAAAAPALEAALRLAVKRYGPRLSVNGTGAFKERIAQAAAAARLDISFADAALERRRIHLITNPQSQEINRDRHATRHAATGRVRPGRGGTAAARRGPAQRANVRGAGRNAGARTHRDKPNVGGIGRKPPPEGHNRLRSLSQLGLVRIDSGGEVLLPRDVSRHVEQQGAEPAHALRRPVPGAGRVTPPQTPANKFIAERESKRAKGLDVPAHRLHSDADRGAAAYAGTREIDGQYLALLKKGDQVLVLPIDAATASRMKRLRVGDQVTTAQGSLKRVKGQTR